VNAGVPTFARQRRLKLDIAIPERRVQPMFHSFNAFEFEIRHGSTRP
jgi:hypothetical protein